MKKSLKRRRASVAATLTSMVWIGSACGGDADAKVTHADSLAVPVRVETIASQSVAPSVTATGMLAGKEEVALSFKIGGVVARVAVDEGANVQQGQVLAELSRGGSDEQMGDAFLHGFEFVEQGSEEIIALFGAEFAARIAGLRCVSAPCV